MKRRFLLQTGFRPIAGVNGVAPTEGFRMARAVPLVTSDAVRQPGAAPSPPRAVSDSPSNHLPGAWSRACLLDPTTSVPVGVEDLEGNHLVPCRRPVQPGESGPRGSFRASPRSVLAVAPHTASTLSASGIGPAVLLQGTAFRCGQPAGSWSPIVQDRYDITVVCG